MTVTSSFRSSGCGKTTLALVAALVTLSSCTTTTIVYQLHDVPKGVTLVALHDNPSGRPADAATINTLEASLEANGDDFETRRALCLAYGGNGGWVEAMEHCDHALQLNPESADVHAIRSALFLDILRPQPAFDAAARATALAPDNTRAREYLARSALLMGNHEVAIAGFETVLGAEPARDDIYLMLATSHEALGNLAGAQSTLERGREATRGSRAGRERIENSLSQLKHRIDARLAAAESALRDDPNSAYDYTVLASGLSDMGFHTRAIATLDDAIVVVGRHHEAEAATAWRAEILYLKGVVYSRAGDHHAAVAALLDSVAVSDRRAAACWYRIGLSRGALGQSTEAIEALERSVELAPDLSENHHALADALEAAGRSEEAAQHRDLPTEF